ncbi:hypothetical protein LguiB_020868 [Lonicera macranthoides]
MAEHLTGHSGHKPHASHGHAWTVGRLTAGQSDTHQSKILIMHRGFHLRDPISHGVVRDDSGKQVHIQWLKNGPSYKCLLCPNISKKQGNQQAHEKKCKKKKEAKEKKALKRSRVTKKKSDGGRGGAGVGSICDRVILLGQQSIEVVTMRKCVIGFGNGYNPNAISDTSILFSRLPSGNPSQSFFRIFKLIDVLPSTCGMHQPYHLPSEWPILKNTSRSLQMYLKKFLEFRFFQNDTFLTLP